MDHAGTDVNLEDLDIRRLFSNHVFGWFIDGIHGIKNIDVIGGLFQFTAPVPAVA
jgi:hypothetical protein